jgi:hypothetical protein
MSIINTGTTTTTGFTVSSDTTGNLVITTSRGFINAASSTGALAVPSGTEAQRPGGVNGMFRYNSDANAFEGYTGGEWGAIGGGGGATNGIFYANSNTIAQAFTSTPGQNYMSSGPLDMTANVTVTIDTNSVWQVF